MLGFRAQYLVRMLALLGFLWLIACFEAYLAFSYTPIIQHTWRVRDTRFTLFIFAQGSLWRLHGPVAKEEYKNTTQKESRTPGITD